VARTVDLKSLARRVLQRDTSRDSERDRVSRQGETASETARQCQGLNPAPVSGVLGVLPVSDVSPPTMAYRATSVGPDGVGCKVEIVELPTATRYKKVFAFLQLKPPALVPVERWRECVADGSKFLAVWGEQAHALGWTSADLFGLHTPPERPHPSYRRLSRNDATGLVWLLQGRPVVALTAETAAIENPSGNVTTYRRYGKPALGPVGDSLDDLK
jgi:hypothetical protein